MWKPYISHHAFNKYLLSACHVQSTKDRKAIKTYKNKCSNTMAALCCTNMKENGLFCTHLYYDMHGRHSVSICQTQFLPLFRSFPLTLQLIMFFSPNSKILSIPFNTIPLQQPHGLLLNILYTNVITSSLLHVLESKASLSIQHKLLSKY